MTTFRRFERKTVDDEATNAIPSPTPIANLAPVLPTAAANEPLIARAKIQTPAVSVESVKTPRIRSERAEKPAKKVQFDHHQDMTDRIIKSIESGVVPWRQDWDGAMAWPSNGTSGRPYHGVNVPMLLSRRFQDDRWATFKQSSDKGWRVRRGEKGTPIYFHIMAQHEVGRDAETNDPVFKKIPYLRRHVLFNFSQIDGAPEKEFVARSHDVPTVVSERIEEMVAAIGAEVVHGFRVPEFQMDSAGTDRICLPSRESFETDAAYYATKLHELVHWTGHPDRLNRVFARDRQNPDYAREELRAELGSAMLCAKLGIPYTIDGHAGYVESYLHLLRDDKKEIYRASRDAEVVVNHILAHHPEYRDEIRVEAGAMAADAKEAGMDEHFDASMFDFDDDLVIDADAVLASYQA